MGIELDYDQQKILNSIEFKSIRELAKIKYPWIEDFSFINTRNSASHLKEFPGIFYVDVIINGDKFLSWCDGCKLFGHYKYRIKDNEEPQGLSLSSLFNISIIESDDIERNLKKISDSFRYNGAIPKEYWMTDRRHMRFLYYIIKRGTTTI